MVYCVNFFLLWCRNVLYRSFLVASGFSMFALGESDLKLNSRNVPIVLHTVYTYKRLYFVERLRKTMDLLDRIQNITVKKGDFFESLEQSYRTYCAPTFFRSQRIKDSMDEIIKTRTLKPLFIVWSDFARYRSIEDEIFVEDFTKEVFIISRNAIDAFLEDKESQRMTHIHSSLNEYIYAIEQITECLGSVLQLQQRVDHMFLVQRDLEDIRPGVDTGKIMHRFYHVGRLKASIAKIKEIGALGNFKLKSEGSIEQIFGTITFTHNRINFAIKKISTIGIVHAVFTLWEDLQQFKYIEDDVFLNESLRFIFLVYQHLFVTFGCIEYAELEAQQIKKFSEQLKLLKIEELLNAVDVVSLGIIKSFPDTMVKKGKNQIILSTVGIVGLCVVSGLLYYFLK